MRRFLRQPPLRVPHEEPGFDESGFVAQYSDETGKYAGGDFQPLMDYVASYLTGCPHARILEIGPGPGWISIRLAQSHPHVAVTGIDVSDAFVAIANENRTREGVADRVTFTKGDAASMDALANNSFDVVVTHQSMHYWRRPPDVFDEVARVLKPTGVFCISDDRRDLTWRGKLQVFLGRRFLSRRIGASWRQSLAGCFTPREVADMLEQSDLRDRWEMQVRPRSMLVTSRIRA